MVGLDAAGKTTILYKLNIGEVVETYPTIGSNVEDWTYRNIKFQVWDLGGQQALRPTWRTYFVNTHAVIMVVDSADQDRLDLARGELQSILQTDELRDACLLIFANKQDIKGALSAAELSESLALHTVRNHDWHIQACCALTGQGLYAGLDWIVNRLKEEHVNR
jgi:small GTP-binding protein